MRADDLVDRLTVLEDDERRNGHHTKLERVFLIVVDIYLDDLELSISLICNLGQNGPERLARTTPRGPEVDQDGGLRLDHFRLERLVRYLNNIGHQRPSLTPE